MACSRVNCTFTFTVVAKTSTANSAHIHCLILLVCAVISKWTFTPSIACVMQLLLTTADCPVTICQQFKMYYRIYKYWWFWFCIQPFLCNITCHTHMFTSDCQLYITWRFSYICADLTAFEIFNYVWYGFDRASSLICGNKMPTRCNKWIFIADLTACSTCFGHLYAHHQEL
jgi:hypothetical protein